MSQELEQLLTELTTAFNTIPFNHMLGLKLETLTENKVAMRFAMHDHLIGNFLHGILHGGVISAVLDMAGGMSAMAAKIFKLARPVTDLRKIIGNCSTADLQVSYLRPGRGEHFIAESSLLKSGNHLTFTRMELFNQAQELIATASGTYLLK